MKEVEESSSTILNKLEEKLKAFLTMVQGFDKARGQVEFLYLEISLT